MLINDIKKDGLALNYLKKALLFLVLLIIIDLGVSQFLLGGLNRYYGLSESSEIAFVGHSELMLGIDKAKFEKETHRKTSKYTKAGVNVADRELMIDQLLRQNPALKVVIYGVDAWMFTGEGLSVNSYKLFYPFMSQFEVSSYIQKQATFFDFWQHKLIRTSRYDEELIVYSFRGYLSNWSNMKFGTVDTLKLKKAIEAGNYRKINSNLDNRIIFERTLKKLNNRGIKVLLVNMPTIDYYNRISSEKFNYETNYFKNIAALNNGISYLELIEPFSHDYSIFFDPVHLNPKGQKLITTEIVKEVNELNTVNK